MMNLISTIMLAVASVIAIIRGDVGFAVLDIALAIMNAPFGAMWIMKKIYHK